MQNLGTCLLAGSGLRHPCINSIADLLADRGHDAQGMTDLRAFLEYHATRRKKILKVFVDINELILRVLAEDNSS